MPQLATLVTPDKIERVLDVTDTFALSRDAVIVPIKSLHPEGAEIVLPDGKVILHPPPADERFEAWLAALPERLAALDLRKTPRKR